MQRQLTRRQRWLAVIILTLIGIGSALLGKWGRLLSVVIVGVTLMILLSGCLKFCQSRGIKQGSGMLLSLVIAVGYVLMILGSYGYLRG
ncbi:hypothetical protein [Lactiplantibacillus plajomi]|uniref:Integral membrane protein n=1 Tax=Lactiplantibacillus plajomi TaxID=1457217 RepID=A0ABV6K5C1_9LACO|nr:hypothetical protein [Lactiplantibacillus plajomi]